MTGGQTLAKGRELQRAGAVEILVDDRPRGIVAHVHRPSRAPHLVAIVDPGRVRTRSVAGRIHSVYCQHVHACVLEMAS